MYGSNADFKATFMEFDGHEIGIQDFNRMITAILKTHFSRSERRLKTISLKTNIWKLNWYYINSMKSEEYVKLDWGVVKKIYNNFYCHKACLFLLRCWDQGNESSPFN